MLTFPMVPGIEVSIPLLIFLSLAAGTISGFVGVGGGFIMTPALIIMGFPAQIAVGTGVLWVMGNSIIGTLRHRRLGNVDVKLGLLMIIFMMGGMEIGIRLLDAASNAGLADTAVLSVTICALLIVGGSIFLESARTKSKMDKAKKENKGHKTSTDVSSFSSSISRIKLPPLLYFSKSDVRISLWMIICIGLGAGILAGFIGVGGGFVIVPSLVYIFGVPSFIAVGTSLFQIIFPAAFGAARYTMEGNVLIFASFVMILGSSIGIYFGAQLTKYLHEISMRYVLASTILVAVLGSIMKMILTLSDTEPVWLDISMSIITFGGLAVIFLIIISLFITAIRRNKGHSIPSWLHSFIKD